MNLTNKKILSQKLMSNFIRNINTEELINHINTQYDFSYLMVDDKSRAVKIHHLIPREYYRQWSYDFMTNQRKSDSVRACTIDGDEIQRNVETLGSASYLFTDYFERELLNETKIIQNITFNTEKIESLSNIHGLYKQIRNSNKNMGALKFIYRGSRSNTNMMYDETAFIGVNAKAKYKLETVLNNIQSIDSEISYFLTFTLIRQSILHELRHFNITPIQYFKIIVSRSLHNYKTETLYYSILYKIFVHVIYRYTFDLFLKELISKSTGYSLNVYDLNHTSRFFHSAFRKFMSKLIVIDDDLLTRVIHIFCNKLQISNLKTDLVFISDIISLYTGVQLDILQNIPLHTFNYVVITDTTKKIHTFEEPIICVNNFYMFPYTPNTLIIFYDHTIPNGKDLQEAVITDIDNDIDILFNMYNTFSNDIFTTKNNMLKILPS